MVQSYKIGKKLVVALALLALVVLNLIMIPNKKPSYAADRSSYIVMEANSKTVLKGYNEHLRLPMASTTKIMTALIVIENCKMDEKVKIPPQAVGIEGSSIYLRQGEVFTVEELLYGLMLRSGNDASVALSIHVAKNVENFAKIMNVRAQAMGLKDTNFTNPSGLHDDNHYTSAYDLCYMSCVAMQNPIFRKICSTKMITVNKGESTRYFKNKNKMLNSYQGSNGIKTGYTKKAGRCLVASATKNDITMVSVVLNRGAMWQECANLLDFGFAKYSMP
ncbi:MAG: D-alanyl-D-alanine carboxypeptidase [Clostridiales bacterium]|nr:D-alanyl-D-alanine carboxypeptidase [Clostridiales bacterium]